MSIGIWQYNSLFRPTIASKYQVSLGEGSTPLLADALQTEQVNVWFKRDDLNPTGSFKARSLAYQIATLRKQGIQKATISSSGNAAIAAAAYATRAGVELTVFLSPKTADAKVREVVKYPVRIILSDHAARLCNYMARKKGLANLRPSVDDTAIIGFSSIAFELNQQLRDMQIDHIFTYVSSGSSLLGMHQGFEQLAEAGEIKQVPKLHAVQSGGVTSMAAYFDRRKVIEEKTNLALDQTRRRQTVIDTIKVTGGSGWIMRADEIEQAGQKLVEQGITTSSEGCASYAAVLRASRSDGFKGSTVCMLTGHSYQYEQDKYSDMVFPRLETPQELEDYLEQ